MVSHLKNALADVQMGLEEIQAISNGLTGKLHIGVMEEFDTYHVVQTSLIEYAKNHQRKDSAAEKR